MYEKILQKLKEQRGKTSTISDRTLEDLAKNLQTFITTDEQLNSYDATPILSSIHGNINHTASQAVMTAKKEQEDEEKRKKEEIQRQKEMEEAAKKVAQQSGSGSDNNPQMEFYKQQMEAMNQMANNLKTIQAELSNLKTDKVVTSRKDQLEKALENTPDYFSNTIKAGFKSSVFEKDEDFTAYLQTVKQSAEDAIKFSKKEGLNKTSPGGQQKKHEEDTGETPELSKAMEILTKEKENLKKQENATN